MEEEPHLRPLHPAHVKVLRIQAALVALPLFVAAVVLDLLAPLSRLVPPGLIAGTIALVLLAYVFVSPRRRYRRKGYAMGQDRLRVVRGWWLRRDTLVPFGRVQHIDVNAGVIERLYGLATLVLHTAGNHNAQVSLPGLALEDAEEMRETIRTHIGRASADRAFAKHAADG